MPVRKTALEIVDDNANLENVGSHTKPTGRIPSEWRGGLIVNPTPLLLPVALVFPVKSLPGWWVDG